MKIGDLVKRKYPETSITAPGFGIIVGESNGRFSVYFNEVPTTLRNISYNNVVAGFGPWELEVVSEHDLKEDWRHN